MSLRRYSWAAMAVLLVGALVAGSASRGPRTDEERARAIESTIKCPVCRSQSVETSEAQVSVNIRADVRQRLSQGETADQIRAAMAQTYGNDVQLIPPSSGVAGLVWVLPVAALIVAIGGLALAFRHWRRPLTASATAADQELVERYRADDPPGEHEP